MTKRELLRLQQEAEQSRWKKQAEEKARAAANEKSAQAAARLDQMIRSPSMKKSADTKSAAVAARLDNRISSPFLNYAIGSWQSAFAADRLNNGSYAATGGIKQREIAQKAKEYRQRIRSAQLAANLDNSQMTQSTIDNQRAHFESAMEKL